MNAAPSPWDKFAHTLALLVLAMAAGVSFKTAVIVIYKHWQWTRHQRHKLTWLLRTLNERHWDLDWDGDSPTNADARFLMFVDVILHDKDAIRRVRPGLVPPSAVDHSFLMLRARMITESCCAALCFAPRSRAPP